MSFGVTVFRLAACLVVGFLLIQVVRATDTQVPKITYSLLLREIDAGNVARVELFTDSAVITLKSSPDYIRAPATVCYVLLVPDTRVELAQLLTRYPVPFQSHSDATALHCLWCYYAVAMFIWFGLFWFIFKTLLGNDRIKISFVASHLLCLVILAANVWFQWEAYVPRPYPIEEDVYEYVERNTYYLIVAITIFLLITATKDTVFKNEKYFKLVVYSQAASIALCVIVIALFWMPTEEGREAYLVHLRHIKTVFFTYALSLFFISPVEVFLNVRAEVFGSNQTQNKRHSE